MLDTAYKLGIELCDEAGTNEIPTEKWRRKVIEILAKGKVNERDVYFKAKKGLCDARLIEENQEMTRFYEQASQASQSVAKRRNSTQG